MTTTRTASEPSTSTPAAASWPHRAVFLGLLVASLLPVVSPGLALAVGAVLGLTLGSPYPATGTRLANVLLKASVVGLGFGMSLQVVLEVGRRGIGVTFVAIIVTLTLGLLLTRLLHVEATTGTLISGGTAICGGSAIAALGPAIGAGAGAMGVAMATIFLLNAVALYLFPAVGHLLGLSQDQFALWAAIGIHDTSSVVGAAASYGAAALEQATVLKLTRALWILPVVGAAVLWRRRTAGQGDTQVSIPWFIVLFAVAAAVRGVWPAGVVLYDGIVAVAHRGLAVTLFLIGTSLSRASLRTVGVRPLALGVLLWAIVAASSLGAVLLWVTS